jgi:8-oxo-dGTP pyrophosphatase MutT (NUDIX family)
VPPIRTETQVSAGGVAYRPSGAGIEVAVVCVGERRRWQLPKGLVEAGEAPEAAAVREVREEAGVDAEVVAPIERVEYWYVASRGGARVRYHKFVDFFLMRYLGGDVRDHDHEVHEARWVEASAARELLAFESERRVVERARELVAAAPRA